MAVLHFARKVGHIHNSMLPPFSLMRLAILSLDPPCALVIEGEKTFFLDPPCV
jgi:hypothetical protein